MIFENFFNSGSIMALQQTMAFAEARQEVLADNVSNFDTPGYKMKDLPVEEFFSTLGQVVKDRANGKAGRPLQSYSSRFVEWDRQGHLQIKPMELKDNNILFHDQNNRFVEKQMSDMAQNKLLHNVAVELLRLQYANLEQAIRGKF